MHSRDKIFLASGVILAVGGAVLTLVWGTEAGVIALLALSFVILVVVLLQRRQLARIQQRTLAILNFQQAVKELPKTSSVKSTSRSQTSAKGTQEDLAIATRKIVGLLQAQHVALELLHEKMERNDD